MAKSEDTSPQSQSGPEPTVVVANHLIYHTPGQPPALPGSLVTLAASEVTRLLATGAVRHQGDPARPMQTLTRVTGAQTALPPPAPGADTLPVPPPTPVKG